MSDVWLVGPAVVSKGSSKCETMLGGAGAIVPESLLWLIGSEVIDIAERGSKVDKNPNVTRSGA
jgi:hypothetical protein